MKESAVTRHFHDVKAIACLPLLVATCAWADEAHDRAAINEVIHAINDPARRAGLFTKDGTAWVDLDHLLELHRQEPAWYPPVWGAIPGVNEPWVELTVPRIVSGTIRFLARDVAIVDGASTVAGAVTLAPRVPLLFVMKKEGTEWRIAALRVIWIRAAAEWQPM